MVVFEVVSVLSSLRDEWTEAIQMVADKLQRQEEERIQCSPTSNIDNLVEEEMDISTTHHKRKVAQHTHIPALCFPLSSCVLMECSASRSASVS